MKLPIYTKKSQKSNFDVDLIISVKPKMPKTMNVSDSCKDLKNILIKNKVKYNPVKKLQRNLMESEIIEKVGGDLTKGSCSSLAFAYVGNKCGLDVLDFRGGQSLNVFVTGKNI